jgi:glycosyltransferase involved in cell wall biosynthesis
VTAPRFTVLMPTHYRPDVIGFAVDSVLRQSEPDFELFVVGDGVGDDTRDVVGRYDDERIRFFDMPKAAGLGYANRNVALKEAAGRYIAFAADDDLMFPDQLERMAATLDRDGVIAAYGESLWVSADGIAAPDLTNLSDARELEHFLDRANTMPFGVLAYRREAFEGADHWPDVGRAGDWLIWKHLIARFGLERIRPIREILMMHFSATRVRRRARVPRLRAWLTRADRGEPWPAVLRLKPLSGEPPQAPYALALRNDPGWPAAARGGARDLVDHLALEALERIDFYDRPRQIAQRVLGKVWPKA